MRRTAAAWALLLCIAWPAGAHPAEESLEAIEKDIQSVLSEMETLRSELDRLGEVAALPRATGMRIEILRDEGAPAPAAARLLLDGKPEDEREWSKSERDAFSSGKAPLVVHLPVLPGLHKARFELSHPAWKAPAAAEFPAEVRRGETFSAKWRLLAPSGKSGPSLVPVAEK